MKYIIITLAKVTIGAFIASFTVAMLAILTI